MKAVSNYHPDYTENGYSFRGFGTRVKHFDESAPYEEDEAILLVDKKGLYTILEATGCSCWDGDWEGWTEVTKPQLKKLGKTWTKLWGAAKELGEWIERNI